MALERVKSFLEIFAKVKSSFSGIKFSEYFKDILLCEGYSLEDFVNNPSVPRRYILLLLGLRRYPFIEDDSQQATSYCEYTFYLHKNEEKIKCDGLAAACLYGTAGIGFYSEDFWSQIEHTLTKSNETLSCELEVLCLSHLSHPNSSVFKQWFVDIKEVTLIVASGENKTISLRNDHGKDILNFFADKLISNPYILKVMNSLPFNPCVRKFIKKCYSDGKIELVLHWTDSGYGMIIQTTGRNLRETAEIARILKEKYDQ